MVLCAFPLKTRDRLVAGDPALTSYSLDVASVLTALGMTAFAQTVDRNAVGFRIATSRWSLLGSLLMNRLSCHPKGGVPLFSAGGGQLVQDPQLHHDQKRPLPP